MAAGAGVGEGTTSGAGSGRGRLDDRLLCGAGRLRTKRKVRIATTIRAAIIR